MNKILRDGLSPLNSLWDYRFSGTPSFFKVSRSLPTASASGWAKKFDISSSWLDTGSPSNKIGVCDFVYPINSAGITLP